MTLEGQGLMLASFHGVNFRAKYWALFNIKDPYIYFSTEAQKIPEGGKKLSLTVCFLKTCLRISCFKIFAIDLLLFS